MASQGATDTAKHAAQAAADTAKTGVDYVADALERLTGSTSNGDTSAKPARYAEVQAADMPVSTPGRFSNRLHAMDTH